MLHASLDHMGFRQKVLEQQAIMRWKETVGPQIAASSVAEKVRDGALFVCCKSSMWANELSLHKQDIIKRLNKSLGKQIIIDIRFSARGFKQALEARTQKEPLPTVSETLDTVQVGPGGCGHSLKVSIDLALPGACGENPPGYYHQQTPLGAEAAG